MTDNPTNTSSSDLTGRTLGQYEIGQQLGQGGMATVYVAQQTSIGRTVAIKVMPSYFMGEPNFLQRFEREVKVIAGLQHPRVLPVFDYGQLEGRPYIVMAYMPGGTLADKIRQGPMPLSEVSRLITQIAEGLDHAHNKGVIHRDFKPSNVLLDENGNAHLADFGIAKISESTVQLTGSGIVGTPAYMAPEMAETGAVTPAVDIYALGITLYQMLAGKYPYQGETPIRVMMAHAQDPIPDVRQVRPDVPEAVSQVVMKAMAKNPADRYATAGELAADLRAALAGQPISAPAQAPSPGPAFATFPVPVHSSPPTSTPLAAPMPYTPLEQPRKKGFFRNPVVIIGLIVVGLVCVCGGLFLMGVIGSNNNGSANGGGTTEANKANLVVNNESGKDICKLYIAPAGSSGPGTEQLNGSPISAGSTHTISGLDTGQYDLTARDCGDVPVATDYGLTLAQGDFNWTINAPEATAASSDHSNTFQAGSGNTPSAATTASLVVTNQTGETICKLYVRPAGTTEWGDNQLGSQQIQNQAQFTLNAIPEGRYDLRAETCDSGNSAEHLDADLSGEMTWTLSPANQ